MDEKKTNKVKTVLIAVGILVLFLIGQLVIGGIGGAVGGVFAAVKGEDVMEYTLGLVPLLTLITEIVFIIVFGLWYYFGYVKKDIKNGTYESGFSKMKSPQTCIFLIVITLGTHFFILLVSALTQYLIPSSQDLFNELMGLTLGDDNIAGYLAAMLVAPIAEELVFRGVILKKLRESFGLIGCALISAILFGIMHLNPMQSIYVLPMGFMFAYLAYKYDSVIPAITAHILNNCAAILIPRAMGRNLKNIESIILFVLFMIPTVLIGRRMNVLKMKTSAVSD